MADEKRMTSDQDVAFLFATFDGPFGRALERLRLVEAERLRVWRAALFSMAVTYLPLLILAAVDGVATGERVEVALVEDFLPYGQFLMAVPLLILAEAIVGRRIGWAVAELRQSDILMPEDEPRFDRLLAGAVEKWRGRTVNLVLLALTVALIVVSLWGVREWLTGGWQYQREQLTLAGWWYLLVSMPVVRFLALRWMWRWLLWAWVLWRLAWLQLRPRPGHPDRAGGLAFLGGTQSSFGWLALASGVQLSCLIADAVYYHGENLMSFRGNVLTYVLTVVVVLLLPLVVFTPRLAYARESALIALSRWGYSGIRRLEERIDGCAPGEWPNEDCSGMADFSAVYENARLMKPVPLEIRHVMIVMAAAILPFIPLVFLVMPAQEVLKALVNLLI